MYIKKIISALIILLSTTLVSAQVTYYINVSKADFLQGGSAMPKSDVNHATSILYTRPNPERGSYILIGAHNPAFIHNSGDDSKNFTINERHIYAGIKKLNSTFTSKTNLTTGGKYLVFDRTGQFPIGSAFRLWFDIPNFNSYNWHAGAYANTTELLPLQEAVFFPSGLHPVTILVPKLAELIEDNWNTWSFFINNPAQYDTDLTGAFAPGTLLHTVPVRIKVRAQDTKFTVVDAQNTPIDIDIPINVLRYNMGGSQIAMSAADQTISEIGTLPIGNQTHLPSIGVTISAADLRHYFNKPGTYTIQLTNSFQDMSDGALVTSYKHTLQIQVANLNSFTLSASQIDLRLQTANDYTSGVSKGYADHFTITQMAPYTVSVKANTNSFTRTDGGIVIPTSALQIGLASTQDPTNFNIIQLSTSPQILIRGQAAFLQKYSVLYSIPAVESKKIVDTAPANSVVAGTYTGIITYTMTAQ